MEGASNHTEPVDFSSELFRTVAGRAGGIERILRAVLAGAQEIVFVKDVDGRYILVNPAFARFVGRPITQIIGKTDSELFPTEAEALRNDDRRVLSAGKPVHTMDRITLAGEERIFLTTKIPIPDESGSEIAICGLAAEITGEVRVREQLTHLNRVLHAIRKVNQLITREKDKNRLLQGVCDDLAETRGYRGVWIALLDSDGSLTSFFHSGLGRAATAVQGMLKSGRFMECARRARERPGVVVIADPASECGDCPLLREAPEHRKLVARLEYDGKLYGLIAAEIPREYAAVKQEQELFSELAEDVGFGLYRLEAEAARRESEERFRSIVENSHAGIMMIDANYRIVYMNDSLTRIFGWERDEVIGHDFREFLDEESRELVAERYRRRQAGEDVPARYEFNVLGKDGAKRRVEAASSVIRDAAGEVRTIAQLLDITARKRMEERLRAIYSLTRQLALSTDPEEIADEAVKTARKVLGMRDCSLYLIDREKEALVLAAHSLAVDPKYHELPLASERGIMAAVAQTGVAAYLPDVSRDPRYIPGREENRSELCVPLKVGTRTIGVLNVESTEPDAFGPEDQELLESLADGVAVALEGARLYRELEQEHARLRQTLDGIIAALTAAIELRDPYTAGHQLRVAELATAIGEEMGLCSDKIEAIRYAGLVHDIGKLAVPAEILAKPSELTAAEYAIIKSHPEQAYDILKEIDFPWPVADIVLQHHERLDGSGYPQGLKGDEIRLESRIIAVADVVEAMSSHRPYRPARGIDAALEEIRRNKGKLYDPDVVDACLAVFEKGFAFSQ